MYIYHNGNEYTGAIQWINGLPYDAMGQELTYTETASSGLEAGNESGVMQAQALADWEGEEQSWHNILLGVDKEDIQPNLRDEGTGFFKSLQIAFSNLGTDFVVETDYIVQAAESPIDTGEAILKVVAGYLMKALPSDWDKYLPDDWQSNKEYANAINAYYNEKYGERGRLNKEKLLDSIAEQPISVILDFYAIKAIATAVAAKAARTAKATGTSKDIAIAEELATYERTVIDKGGLVWHEGLGAWVDSSMIPRLAQQVDDIAIGADRSGMLTYQNKAKIGDAVMYEYPIMNAAQRAAYEARTVARENARKPAVVESVKGEKGVFNTVAEDVTISAKEAAAADAYTVYEPLRNVPKEEMIVLADAIKTAKADAQVVREQWMDIINDAGDAVAEAFHHSDVVPAMNKVHDANIAHLEAQKLNRADRPDLMADIDELIVVEKVHQLKNVEDIRYAEAYELYAQSRLAADTPAAVTAIDLAGTRAADGSLKVATQADEAKLARIERQLDDDAKVAAATQAELFSTANAAAYENYQNLVNVARVANEAKVTNLKKTGMLDTVATESRLGTRQPTYTTPKPVSVPSIASESRLGTRKPEYPVPSIPKARISTESRTGSRQPTYTPPSLLRATSQGAQRLSAASQNIPDYTLPDMPVGIESRLGTRQPTYTTPDVETKKEIPPPPERRAGWMQGNTYADNDGNWWSADFDHEHWNTPAGVNEAISIWGRPMGTRHSWETPAAIKSQYTYRQKPDFSWMNEYD